MLQLLLTAVIHAALWVYLGCLLVLCGKKKAPTDSKPPTKPNPADGAVKGNNCVRRYFPCTVCLSSLSECTVKPDRPETAYVWNSREWYVPLLLEWYAKALL